MQQQTQESLALALRKRFLTLYPGHDVQALLSQTFTILGIEWQADGLIPSETLKKWDQRDAFLITYGDSIREPNEKGLATFTRFYREHLAKYFNAVHILPFHPYTSDDGFAVSDFSRLREGLGHWGDLKELSQHARVMGDLVINHISSEHPWFTQFLDNTAPGKDYIYHVAQGTEVTQVTRPRSHPLLQRFDTTDGEKWVWCTFSRDQVDLDFTNPDVFMEMLQVLLNYIAQGVSVVRLDAVGFIWKEMGTNCLSLPQAHAIVQALRAAVTSVAPDTLFITETNVPLAENLSYFGQQDEAHMVYNFSLAPVLSHAILSGKTSAIRKCLMRMPSSPAGCAFFNFTASHDGIGLRPAEALLNDDEIAQLIAHSTQMGGEVSYRELPNKTLKAYELNITLASLFGSNFAGENQLGLERFVLSQAIAMSIEGVPAIYIQSIFAALNDRSGFENSGMPRRINRKPWGYKEAEFQLLHEPRARSAFNQLTTLLQIRQGQPAFHPNATQYTLNLGPHVLGVWRESLLKDQSIFCVFNLSDQRQLLPLNELNLLMTHHWVDLISQIAVDDPDDGVLVLAPYQIVWLANKDGRHTSDSLLLQTYQSQMPL